MIMPTIGTKIKTVNSTYIVRDVRKQDRCVIARDERGNDTQIPFKDIMIMELANDLK